MKLKQRGAKRGKEKKNMYIYMNFTFTFFLLGKSTILGVCNDGIDTFNMGY